MRLAERCYSNFEQRTRSRGFAYYSERRITFYDEFPARLEAEVEGTVGPYIVSIDWKHAKKHSLEASCTCPRYEEGHLCKHIWATLLEMDEVGMQEAVPGKSPLLVTRRQSQAHVPSQATAPPSTYCTPSSGSSRVPSAVPSPLAAPGRTATPASGSVTPPWAQRLERVRMHHERSAKTPWSAEAQSAIDLQAVYLLNVGATITSQTLVIDLFQRRRKKDGTFGEPRRTPIASQDFKLFSEPSDQRLLHLMLGNVGGSDLYYSGASHARWLRYGYASPTAEIYDVLLPELCATGRFCWLLDNSLPLNEASPIRWDERRWQFRLCIEEDAERHVWRIDGQLVQGDEVVSPREAVLLTADGLLLLPDRLARYNGAEHFGWIDVLRRSGAVEVPFDDRDRLLDAMWSMPDIPPVVLPDSLQVDQQRIAPKGRVTFLSGADRRYPKLFAQIGFAYGDRTVLAETRQGAVYDAADRRVLVRDRAAERELVEQLRPWGAEMAPDIVIERRKPDVSVPRSRFVEFVDLATQAGWVVMSEGQRIRRPGSFSMSVKSDVDWFELDGSIDFDGVTASLPSLLQAVRSGHDCVKLDDGSKGMLPNEWLEKYGRLAEMGRAEGDALRFAPSQTLLLDALLADQEDVRVDQRFIAFRRKLQSFSGIKPSSPKRSFRGQLREYQREGLGWLRFLKEFSLGGCLADDMGLGKTVQVLALLEAERTRPVGADSKREPSLVVVPKSLIFNWMDEAARFTPRIRVLNYTGLGRAAELENLDNFDLLVTTYGTLRRDILKLKEIPFHYVILDEAQAIKNHQSQAAKASRLLRARHRLALTGTPVENHLGELWSLFEFLNPGMLGRSHAFNALARSRGDNGDDGALTMLARGLQPFLLRRTKEQVLTELPEKTEQTLHCQMAPKQRRLYEELRDYYRAQLNQRVATQGLEKSKIHVLEALLRLRQAACHPGLVDPKRIGDPSAKIESLLEQVDEIVAEGHKALVFSQFTSLLAIVRQLLDRRGITYEYLDGSTSRRADHVKRFQEDPECPLFLISLKAGGQGLNLTAADYVFILDPWWNPAVEAQAVDRAYRIGQTRRVFAYRMICQDTVEEKIVELQQSKRELADAVVTADDSVLRNLTAEDLQLLLS